MKELVEKAIREHIADKGMVTAPNKLIERICSAISPTTIEERCGSMVRRWDASDPKPLRELCPESGVDVLNEWVEWTRRNPWKHD